MPKNDLVRRTDQIPHIRNGELVTGATVIQVSQLAMTSPFSGDFQIVDEGRLIVGENPDLGARVIVTNSGLHGYGPSGIHTMGLYSKGDATHTGGDWFAGNQAANYISYNQADGVLGLYSPAGAGFIATRDGSLQAGNAAGAHMLWNSASRALEIRSGEDIKISLADTGDGYFDGTIYASGGRIYGDMQVDAQFRVGDVDGPSITLGKFERVNDANELVESSEIIATDAENLPWFHVVAGGSTAGGGWFQVGNPGDYQQRMTYDGERLSLDGDIYARGGEIIDLTLTGNLTMDGGSIIADTVTIDDTGIIIDALLGKYDGGGIRWIDDATSNEYLRIGTQVDLGSVTGSIIDSQTTGLFITSAENIYIKPGSGKTVDIGGDANYAQFAADGTLTLAGTARYERHVQIDAIATGAVVNQPTPSDFFTAGGLQYPTTGAKYAFCQWKIPDDWDGADVYFEIDWFPDSGAISGTAAVRWTVEYRAIAEGEAINNGTSVTLDNGAGGDTGDYSQYQTKHTRVTLAYNNANQPLTKQDHVYFKVSRDTGVANNFSGSVTVTAYEIIYTSTGFPSSN